MNSSVIIGNLFSLFGMLSEAFSATLKTARRVLVMQSIAQIFWFTSTVVLKGYSGSVQNVVSIVRNILAIKKVENKAIEWTVAIIGVVLGICFNKTGIMGYLPVMANFQYTVAVFRFKDNERALKKSFLVCVLMFAFFHLSIYNVVGFISNLMIFATTGFVLVKDRAKEKTEKKQ